MPKPWKKNFYGAFLESDKKKAGQYPGGGGGGGKGQPQAKEALGPKTTLSLCNTGIGLLYKKAANYFTHPAGEITTRKTTKWLMSSKVISMIELKEGHLSVQRTRLKFLGVTREHVRGAM